MLLKHDIKELEVVLKRDIAEVKRDMKEMELRMTIKLGAITTSGIIIVAAIVKLL